MHFLLPSNGHYFKDCEQKRSKVSSVVKSNCHIYRDRVCNRFLKMVIFGITGKVVNSGSQFIFASRRC